MSKHTPGPWFGLGANDGNWKVYPLEGARKPVALIDDVANARLITKAPEMYELLKQVAEYANPGVTDDARKLLAEVDGE